MWFANFVSFLFLLIEIDLNSIADQASLQHVKKLHTVSKVQQTYVKSKAEFVYRIHYFYLIKEKQIPAGVT